MRRVAKRKERPAKKEASPIKESQNEDNEDKSTKINIGDSKNVRKSTAIPQAKAKEKEKEKESENEVAFDIYYHLGREERPDLLGKLSAIKKSETKFGATVVYFITQLLGLDKVVKDYDIHYQKLQEECEEWLENIQVNPKKITTALFDHQDDSLFMENFNMTLQSLFKDKYNLLSETPILQHFAEMARTICKSKVRGLRMATVKLINILINHCKESNQRRLSKDALESISSFLLYNVETLGGLMRDVCQQVRNKSAEIIFETLRIEFVDKAYVLKTYSDVLDDGSDATASLSISYIFKLFYSKTHVDLVQFCTQIFQRLCVIAQERPSLSYEALDLLILFRRHSRDIKINEHRIIDLMINLASSGNDNTKLLAELYYVTMFQEYRIMPEEELIECMKNSRPSITSQQAIQTAICIFQKHNAGTDQKIQLYTKIAQYDQQLYQFQTLFEYLKEQNIKEQDSKKVVRPMTKSELQNLLLLIFATAQSVHTNKWLGHDQKTEKLQEYDREIFEFNNLILGRLIPRHQDLREDFIRLYTALDEIKSQEDIKRMSGVFQYLKDMFVQEADDANTLRIILAAAQKINPDEGIVQLLALTNQDKFQGKLSFMELNKLNQLYEYIDWTEVFPICNLAEIMPKFFSSDDQTIQILIIQIFHKVHAVKLKQILTNDPFNSDLQSYVFLRNSYVEFLVTIMEKHYLSIHIRQLAMVHLCELFSVILNTKLNSLRFLEYTVPVKSTRSLYQFLYNSIIKLEDKNKMNSSKIDSYGDLKIEWIDYDKIKINPEKIMLVEVVVKLISESLKFAMDPLTSKFIALLLRTPSTSQLIKKELAYLVNEETLADHKDSFVFWKMFKNIIFQERLKQPIQKMLCENLLGLYQKAIYDYKNKKRHVLVKRFLLFFAEELNIAIMRNQTGSFVILKNIFQKMQKKVDITVVKRFLNSVSRLPNTAEMRALAEETEFKEFRKYLKNVYDQLQAARVRNEERQKKKEQRQKRDEKKAQRKSQRGSSSQKRGSSSQGKRTQSGSEAESGSESEDIRSSRGNSSSSRSSRQSSSQKPSSRRRNLRSRSKPQSILDNMRNENRRNYTKLVR